MPSQGPARLQQVADAARKGLGVQELLSPLNCQDILAAARATGEVIPVHVYLYSHYNKHVGFNFTNSQQLREFVATELDPKLVKVVGFMTHNGGLTTAAALKRTSQFNQVVCPVARSLATQQPIMLHFASSGDIPRLMPEAGGRMQPPADLCQGQNITWAARIGKIGYGESSAAQRQLLRAATAPVMTWWAQVDSTQTEAAGPDGRSRQVAVVNLAPKRFPSPSLCRRVAHMVRSGAGITSAGQAVSATMPGGPEAIQPHDAHAPLQQSLGTASFVYIAGRRHNATRHADSESALVVDVSHTAAGRAVQVGDSVCLLCAEHRLGDLAQEIRYNVHQTALCLSGLPPTLGSLQEPEEGCLDGCGA